MKHSDIDHSGLLSLSYGSNATRLRKFSGAGSSNALARADHFHDGIADIISNSSNTLSRGALNLRMGSVTWGLDDSDGDGVFDRMTLNAPAAGSGGSGWTPEFATQQAKVTTTQSTSSTTFADLATTGPSVTLTVGASGKVKLSLYAQGNNSSAVANFLGIVISGANTVAAATYVAFAGPANKNSSGGRVALLTGLAAGSTTFKMQYAVDSGTCDFSNRELIAEAVY